MRLSVNRFFLTLVLMSGWTPHSLGAPKTQLPPPIPTQEDIESMDESVPLTRTRRFNTFTTTGTILYWSGPLLSKGENTQSHGVGLTYTAYSSSETAWEYQGQFLANKLFGGDIGYKIIYWYLSQNDPYLKLGMGALYNASDGLPTLTNAERYQIRISTGLENISHRRRLRGELQIAHGLLGTSFSAAIGLAF